MVFFSKVYIWLGKITYLSLQDLPSLFNLKNINIVLTIHMRNYDFAEKKLQVRSSKRKE